MNWKHKLDIKEAWDKASEDDDFKELSRVVIKKLKKLDFGPDFNDERDGLVDAFQDLIDDKTANVNEFDSLWNDLYDFADTALDHGKKLLWVATF